MMYFNLCAILLTFIAAVVTERCITPNNEEAECVSLVDCRILLGAFASGKNASVEFVRQSRCGGGNDSYPMVCCGSSVSSRSQQEPVYPSEDDADLIPSRKYCGYQHADDFVRIGNHETISIYEFPWVALLLFEDSNKVVRGMCAGSLITHRYVLTAAHCTMHHKYKLIAVRLGEHDVKNKTDCTEDGEAYECTDPVVEFGIEKKIAHPGFNWRNFTNNIALVRLNKSVVYSDFIRPICLPFPGTTFAEPGDTVTMSGWSKRIFGNATVEIKKRFTRTLINNTECASTYTTRPIRQDQFCTRVIDTHNELLCQGDSGGPIMFSYKHQWHQEGIFNSGTNCSSLVGVHIKIANYIDWIKENVEW